jgi:probable dihydroxyacetone kinase regulator
MITQQAMANSLKRLMKVMPIDSIHVQMITEDCGLTRHTFYNHFRNVYDLLGWIYDREVIDGLEQYCTLQDWQKGLRLVLDYTLDNRIVCLNTFHSIGRDLLEDFLHRVFFHLLHAVVEDISRTVQVSGNLKSECCEFYADALVGVFVAWLKDNLMEDPERMVRRIDRMLSGSIVSLLERYADQPF